MDLDENDLVKTALEMYNVELIFAAYTHSL